MYYNPIFVKKIMCVSLWKVNMKMLTMVIIYMVGLRVVYGFTFLFIYIKYFYNEHVKEKNFFFIVVK